MPARDLYHDTVVEALKADGWTITHDPYHVAYGNRNLYIDLGAERATIAAEKNDRKIVVEIKSFLSVSAVNDFEDAVWAVQHLSYCARGSAARSRYFSSSAYPRLRRDFYRKVWAVCCE
jgi:hypothetical protein